MGYKYRWIWAVSLIFICLLTGYINDFRELMDDLDLMHDQEKKWQATPLHSPKRVKIKSVFTKSEEINSFIRSIEASGLVIKSIHSRPEKTPQWLQIVLEGNYFQSLWMINQLEKNSRVIRIKQFFLKVLEGNSLQMNMEIMVEKGWKQAEISMGKMHSPFCQRDFMEVMSAKDLSFYSVREMKMVGYLQRGNQRAALLMMPDHGVRMVNEDEVVGVEKGKVVGIEQDDVQVKLQDEVVFIKAAT